MNVCRKGGGILNKFVILGRSTRLIMFCSGLFIIRNLNLNAKKKKGKHKYLMFELSTYKRDYTKCRGIGIQVEFMQILNNARDRQLA